ncbi:NAD-dependent epimerase [Candidatus Poribacteria bacterium]|nr:NAD-dependent epimerase [Candidatus Poribacteria bacterium]
MVNPKIAFKNKKVLITGGLGFIGSNLAIRLVKLSADVTLVDSLIPEYGGNLFNIDPVKDDVTINISDVRDPFSIAYLVKEKDFLFNLAGQTSHLDSMHHPDLDLRINASAQLAILEACRQYNPDIKIVFASTRQLYGKPKYLPVDEAHPLSPVDVNGINKLAGEQYHLLYSRVYGLHVCALRLTNTIGPRMRIKDARQTFVGVWVRRVLDGEPFEVWGGEQLRDFTYVSDCVDALLYSVASPQANGKIYNLGGVDVVSLSDLAELIVKLNPDSEYLVKEFPVERKRIDIGDYYSSYQLIEKELGWKPKVNLHQAMLETFIFFKQSKKMYYN